MRKSYEKKKNTILKFAEEGNKRDRNMLSSKRQPRDTSEEDIYTSMEEDIWTTRKINR